MAQYKRDLWTNEEVIRMLEGFKMVDHRGNLMDLEWNRAVTACEGQFWDFIKSADQYAAMAYDTESRQICVIGPQLPR